VPPEKKKVDPHPHKTSKIKPLLSPKGREVKWKVKGAQQKQKPPPIQKREDPCNQPGKPKEFF